MEERGRERYKEGERERDTCRGKGDRKGNMEREKKGEIHVERQYLKIPKIFLNTKILRNTKTLKYL